MKFHFPEVYSSIFVYLYSRINFLPIYKKGFHSLFLGPIIGLVTDFKYKEKELNLPGPFTAFVKNFIMV